MIVVSPGACPERRRSAPPPGSACSLWCHTMITHPLAALRQEGELIGGLVTPSSSAAGSGHKRGDAGRPVTALLSTPHPGPPQCVQQACDVVRPVWQVTGVPQGGRLPEAPACAPRSRQSNRDCAISGDVRVAESAKSGRLCAPGNLLVRLKRVFQAWGGRVYWPILCRRDARPHRRERSRPPASTRASASPREDWPSRDGPARVQRPRIAIVSTHHRPPASKVERP
jgi:hypothetical protein